MRCSEAAHEDRISFGNVECEAPGQSLWPGRNTAILRPDLIRRPCEILAYAIARESAATLPGPLFVRGRPDGNTQNKGERT